MNRLIADADSVIIGSNDLTHFILAVDPNALALIDDYTVMDPSVSQALHLSLSFTALANLAESNTSTPTD